MNIVERLRAAVQRLISRIQELEAQTNPSNIEDKELEAIADEADAVVPPSVSTTSEVSSESTSQMAQPAAEETHVPK